MTYPRDGVMYSLYWWHLKLEKNHLSAPIWHIDFFRGTMTYLSDGVMYGFYLDVSETHQYRLRF